MFGELSLGKFDKELGDLSFLENEYFGDGSERIEFIENMIIIEFEDDSLVDTN